MIIAGIFCDYAGELSGRSSVNNKNLERTSGVTVQPHIFDSIFFGGILEIIFFILGFFLSRFQIGMLIYLVSVSIINVVLLIVRIFKIPVLKKCLLNWDNKIYEAKEELAGFIEIKNKK